MNLIKPKVERARIETAMRNPPVPILDARECVEEAFKRHPGKIVVSWSGGKCSTAVLCMAKERDPQVPVVWNNTGVHFPETLNFVKHLTKAWDLNLTTLKPKQSFWSCVKEYGFPMLRGIYTKTSKSKDGKPKCCQILKEQPFHQFLKDSGFEATLTGLRAAESRMRTLGMAHFGQYYYAKTLKHWRFHPIAFWSQLELDQFHYLNRIPENKIYGMGQERSGCWPCTGYITWQRSLRKSHPKMYRFLAKQSGQPTLWEYLDHGTCIQFLSSEGLL